MNTPRILVLIATYNERDNLGSLIAQIHTHVPYAHVLVIDDRSPDGTGVLADQLAREDARICVLHRSGKLGLGTALLAGLRFALENQYDFCVNMDGDLSHHPRYLPALLEQMQCVDIAIGSRYISGGKTKGWPLRRRWISRSVNLLVRVLTRIPAHDTSSSFRCYRVCLLWPLLERPWVSRGYSFQQEFLFHCWQSGCRLAEVPIVFEDRSTGSSKANVREMVLSFSVLLYLGVRTFFGWERTDSK